MKCTYSLVTLGVCLVEAVYGAGHRGWDRVQGLAPGESVEVLLQGSESVTGAIDSVSSDYLTIARQGGSTQVTRWAVRRVWTVEKHSRLKRVVLGALIGFAGGCTLGATRAGYITDMNNPPAGTRAQVCFAMGAITGGRYRRRGRRGGSFRQAHPRVSGAGGVIQSKHGLAHRKASDRRDFDRVYRD